MTDSAAIGASGRRYTPEGYIEVADGAATARVWLRACSAGGRALPSVSDSMGVEDAQRYALNILAAVGAARYQAAHRSA